MAPEMKMDGTNYGDLCIDDRLDFHCSAGLACFTACCRDVNIFLSPYDILRMKNALRISSGDFLDSFTMEYDNALEYMTNHDVIKTTDCCIFFLFMYCNKAISLLNMSIRLNSSYTRRR